MVQTRQNQNNYRHGATLFQMSKIFQLWHRHFLLPEVPTSDLVYIPRNNLIGTRPKSTDKYDGFELS